jgi:glycosyltransferase involved in cell wall biosynthesis
MIKRVRIVHVINSFEFGGAEAMLCNLLLRTDRDRFEPTVAALIDDMSVAGPLLQAAIPIVSMRMRPGIPDPRGLARLAQYLKQAKPAVVHTWMDHSNLLGGVAARLATGAKVVWGVHHSNHVPGFTKRSTLMTVGACARLSRYVPARIVFCSEQARKRYSDRGFDKSRMMVIPNGFDTRAFRPDPTARIEVRRELGLGPGAVLVGLVARFDPLKDHRNFLRAASIVAKKAPETRFVLCGDKVTPENPAISAEIATRGLSAHCHLLGGRHDVARLQAAFDVAVSSSISEAFPLVVGEAMSCGVPCAVTDVGDSALIVGTTGHVVPPSDPVSLAAAVCALIEMPAEARRKLGLSARERVRELFDLGAITRRFEALYDGLALERSPADACGRTFCEREQLAAVQV